MTQETNAADDGFNAGYVQFWSTGESVKGEFHCAECGYGIAVCRELPRCPMCGGESWEQAPWSPFARADGAARL
jgi:rubrerythrin